MLRIALYAALTALTFTQSIDKKIVNTNVERSVDLSSHYAKTITKVTFENKESETVYDYFLTIEPELVKHAAYISVMCLQDSKEHSLSFKSISVSKGRDGETTVFNMPSSKVQSYTETKPVSKIDKAITYGPHLNVAAYSKQDVVLHYENNAPCLTITEMTRFIEISHWGNIAVEESIEIHHTGARLKGGFSRFDYQRKQDAHASVKSFKTILPASARDVYYRDQIGNISTSNLYEKTDAVELELRPRFPLFGGWKTQYVVGYNVPSYEYLFHSGDHYALRMRVIDHVYDDQVVDKVTVRVVLPEGASGIKLRTPYDVRRLDDERKHTYLDTVGRTVVVFEKENAIDSHIAEFELEYDYPKIYMLQEPLLVVVAFLALFVSVICLVRLDFTISKDEAQEARLRLASLIDEVQSLQDRRAALYQSAEDAIVRFKATKNHENFVVTRKRVDGEMKSVAEQMKTLQTKARAAHGVDVADKIAQIQTHDSSLRELLVQAGQMAERLIAGKLPKQAYLEQDSANKASRVTLVSKMDAVITSM